MTFAFPCSLPKTTVVGILSAPLPKTELSPTRKATNNARCPELERMLPEWVAQCSELSVAVVTGAAVRYKAEKLRGELLKTLDADAAKTLARTKFSNGWLRRFQARYHLTSRRTQGDAGSTKASVVSQG